jgi:hypothetical protein
MWCHEEHVTHHKGRKTSKISSLSLSLSLGCMTSPISPIAKESFAKRLES